MGALDLADAAQATVACPTRIRRACHALALDDERQTFFPLLWTEHEEPQNVTSAHVDEERVTQVWFAGMHSNVGGGYPDDSLSHTPLAWMAGEAWKRGLRFRAALCGTEGRMPREWIDRGVVAAPMHDSRRGLGVYYRYHPRPVERLCHDTHADVYVERPKIHESVLERIRQDVDGYAPANLPERYAVVTAGGRILDDEDGAAAGGSDHANPYEHPTQRHARRLRQEQALNAVWWRRVAYFLTVAATLVLAPDSRCAPRATASTGSARPRPRWPPLSACSHPCCRACSRPGSSTTSSGPSSCLPASPSSSR